MGDAPPYLPRPAIRIGGSLGLVGGRAGHGRTEAGGLARAGLGTCRALHPPGGAVALPGALGSTSAWGARATLATVLGGSVALVAIGVLWNRRCAGSDHSGNRRSLVRVAIDSHRKRPAKTGEIMQSAAPHVTAEMPGRALLPLLADCGTEAVPVIDGPRIVGIVTRTNLVSDLARRLALKRPGD